MNNTLDRVMDDLIRLLRDDVVPALEGDALRSQVFGAIFMLKNLQLRTDWSIEPLVGQIRAQDALFVRLRELLPEALQALPSAPRIAPDVLSGKQLMVLRDDGNAVLSKLIDSGNDQPEALALITAYMRAELDLEMRHTPKPMFAEMSSGKSQSA